MKYTLIRYAREETKLAWTSDDSGSENHLETTLQSKAEPEPELPKALEALRVDVVRICEFPKEYGGDIEVRSVAFQHRQGIYSVSIHAVKTLEGSQRPFNISTPLFTQPADGEADGKKGMIDGAFQERLDAVIKAAEAFRLGHRAQQDLPLDAGKSRRGRGKGELTPIEEAARGVVPDPAQTAGVQSVDEVLDAVAAEGENETRRAAKREDAFAPGQPLDEFIEEHPELVEDEDVDVDIAPETGLIEGMDGAPLSQWGTRLTPTVVAMLKDRKIVTLGELALRWPELKGTSGFKGKSAKAIEGLLEESRAPEAMPV